MANKDAQRLTGIIQHIKLVENNCNKLAQKVQDNDFDFALQLIQLGRIHDASKLDEFEFNHLHSESPFFKTALAYHHVKNKHHPEHWQFGVVEMPNIYLAEMVCDCVARSQEFGTDVRDWFEKEATVKYNFKMDSHIGVKIQQYLDMLLTPKFR